MSITSDNTALNPSVDYGHGRKHVGVFFVCIGTFGLFDAVAVRRKVFHPPIIFVLFTGVDEFHCVWGDPCGHTLLDARGVDRFDFLHREFGVYLLRSVGVVMYV